RTVSAGFLAAAAEAIARASGGFVPLADRAANAVLISELAPGKLRVAVKSRSPFYTSPAIDLGRPIRAAAVCSEFPSMPPRVDGNTVAVKVPPNGMTVMDVRLAR